MKKTMIICLLLIVLVGCSGTKNQAKYTIGVLQYADHPSLDAAYEGMMSHLNETIGEGNYRLIYQNAQGDNGNNELMARGFASEHVDLIYAIGTNAAQSAMNATDGKEIPVVFNAVTDPVSAGLVDSWTQPGRNITGVSDLTPVEKQMELIEELCPDAHRVGIVYNIGEINSVTQIEKIKSLSSAHSFEIVESGISSVQEIPIATQQLVENVDVIFNITDNMIVASTANIVDIALKQNIPVVASEDGQIGEGILATESLSYYALGESAGALIYDILVEGSKPQNISVVTSTETQLYINNDVAEQLGLEIPESLKSRNVMK